MPTCPNCGKWFSGFSIGSKPAEECGDCRKATALAAAAATASQILARTQPNAAARSAWQPKVTLTLVGLNLAVYVAMGLSGASWFEPSTHDAIRWGANFGPLTLSGQWWRLFSCMFVHFGIVHIGFNMWCLLDLGRSLEFLMGRKAFAVTYVLCGLAASLVSLAWDPWRVSAGASGAIFGVAGAFASVLYLKKTPVDQTIVRRNLKSVGIFIAYNLFYGMRSGVDNSAHLGGLVAGLILGAVFPPMLRSAAVDAAAPDQVAPPVGSVSVPEESRRTRIAANVAFWSVLLLVAAAARIYAVNAPAALYGKAVSLVKKRQFQQGIQAMEQAVKLEPNLLLGQALLGEWQLEVNRPDAAARSLEEALALAPNAYDVQHNLALAYLGDGRPADAIREINQALENEKSDQWRAEFILGVAELERGNPQIAIRHLQNVRQDEPAFAEAQDCLALANAKTDPPTSPRTKSIPYPIRSSH
jgi:membrane associated rhomboid family serine protease/cytochrome c-type biogenesis protein CcmH/NrfG